MGHQANKPTGNYLKSGEVRNVADLQAVKNQAVFGPADYPEKASGGLVDGLDPRSAWASVPSSSADMSVAGRREGGSRG